MLTSRLVPQSPGYHRYSARQAFSYFELDAAGSVTRPGLAIIAPFTVVVIVFSKGQMSERRYGRDLARLRTESYSVGQMAGTPGRTFEAVNGWGAIETFSLQAAPITGIE